MPLNKEKITKQTIQALLQTNVKSTDDLMMMERQIAKKIGGSMAKKSELLNELNKIEYKNHRNAEKIKRILKKRAIRTMSGIAPIAVLTKPYSCPGNCAYCPTEKDVPQSYLSNEPAVMRAIHCGYKPDEQVSYRIKALEANGHQPTKIELIVIGGTWSFFPSKYKYWYIASCFASANNYGKNKKLKLLPKSTSLIELKKWLKKEQAKNEISKYQIIGLTLETRPDYINEKELIEMRELGCTRIEIGVQATDDKILKFNKRGSTVSEIIYATKIMKNYGFKVTYHLMAGLPGSNAKKDFDMFQETFTPLNQIKIFKTRLADVYDNKKIEQLIKTKISNNNFNPDQLKYYPTVVTKGSLLYKWWKQGKYKAYSDKVLQDLITKCKEIVPPFVRIIRIIRDIPGESIIAGNKITNLRQVLKQKGVICNCIRCREARNKKFKLTDLILVIRKYRASDGDEYFISFEDKKLKTLYGFARLRLANNKYLPKYLKNHALLRELHVYGELIPTGKTSNKVQHTGLGKRLMAISENIAILSEYEKMAIISGVGVRGYYKKLGYKLYHTYLTKKIIVN